MRRLMRQKVGRLRGVRLKNSLVEKADSRTALNTRFAENRRVVPYSCPSIPQYLYLYLSHLPFSCSSLCSATPRPPSFPPSLFSPRGILVDTDTGGARSTRQRVLKGVQKWRRGAGDDEKEKKRRHSPNLTPFAATARVYTLRPSLSVNSSWSRFPFVLPLEIAR